MDKVPSDKITALFIHLALPLTFDFLLDLFYDKMWEGDRPHLLMSLPLLPLLLHVITTMTSYGGLFESRNLNLNCKFYMEKCAIAWTQPNSHCVVGSRQEHYHLHYPAHSR